MFCIVSFYISSAKSILISWPWNKPVIFHILSFLEPVYYNRVFLSFNPWPLTLKSKIKHTAPLVKAEKQARVEISIHWGKVLHLQRKTKQEFRLWLSYHIYYSIPQLSLLLQCSKCSKGKAENSSKRQWIYQKDHIHSWHSTARTWDDIYIHPNSSSWVWQKMPKGFTHMKEGKAYRMQ